MAMRHETTALGVLLGKILQLWCTGHTYAHTPLCGIHGCICSKKNKVTASPGHPENCHSSSSVPALSPLLSCGWQKMDQPHKQVREAGGLPGLLPQPIFHPPSSCCRAEVHWVVGVPQSQLTLHKPAQTLGRGVQS